MKKSNEGYCGPNQDYIAYGVQLLWLCHMRMEYLPIHA